MEMNNKTVLITGGSSGIGEALVHSLLKRQNKVIVCCRNEVKNIDHDAGERLYYFKCDLREKTNVLDVFEKLKQSSLIPDVLINNAGIIDIFNAQKGKINYEEMQDVVTVNLLAPILLTHCFVNLLSPDTNACIINVGSQTAFSPNASFLTYSASKAGLHSFSISVRKQLESSKVKVFEVMPPRVDTPMSRMVALYSGGKNGMPIIEPKDCAEKILEAVEADIYEFIIQ